MMTVTEPAPVTLPPGEAQHILDLLATSEAMLCVLKARGERGENQLQASLEEISAHLTDGHDTGHLICLLKQAQRDLESLCLARPPTDPYRDGRDPHPHSDSATYTCHPAPPQQLLTSVIPRTALNRTI